MNIKAHKKTSAGMTLLELMVALVMAAILLTVALPSFLNSIRANQVLTKADSLMGALGLARSEAAKRNIQVSVCKSSDLTNCDTSSTDWQQGWIVFVDTDADGSRDAAETLLQKFSSLPSGYTLAASQSFEDWLAYLPTGALAAGGSVSDGFRLCGPEQIATNGRTVSVNATGRPRVSKGVTSC